MMVIEDHGRTNRIIPMGITFGQNRRLLRLNVVAFAILFIGYFLTTGTKLIESDVLKDAFRFIALFIFLVNVILERAIQAKFMVALYVLLVFLVLSHSQIVVNLAFLLLISASLRRLSGKKIAIVLVIPTILVILLHIILLETGHLLSQSVAISGRVRSSLGFTNANQASAIYLSFVVLALFAHLQFRAKSSAALLVISLASAFAVFQVTDTRTAMFGLFALMTLQGMDFLFNKHKVYQVSLVAFALLSPVLATALTYYIATSIDPELDAILSLRPYFFAKFMSNVTALDFLLGWATIDGGGVDNLFLMLLSGFGAIGYSAIILCILVQLIRMDKIYIPIVIILMGISVFESFLIRPEIPLSVLFFSVLFSRPTQRAKRFTRQII